ncbi:AMP nucleosidase [Herbaspirillum sp. RTI4]|uniref:AMP nucleosidase n=1 Tax=Herbaspirillum sp. RTI4 TaxID=3048640 RepID=UPI002AB45DA3|nr:AMP nucleosidase [Herbaspirillum sp. RTI4]MDY7577839.1 AMP nucleosidase [Herbaspirillum sp. RTI4]MEA9982457.1 AMP nucleosidase [Herbaspirillum sp. RTI4]
MFSSEQFTNAEEAVERVISIYESHTALLRAAFGRFSSGELLPARTRACYPFVRIATEKATHADTRQSFGFVAGPGVYETTLTQPVLFKTYLLNQFQHLLDNHGVPLEIGVSDLPIPVHFAFAEGIHVEGDLDPEHLRNLPDLFDLPDLSKMDDRIVNGTFEMEHDSGYSGKHPLALFTAPRVDYSLHRLRHYTATSPDQFQRYVLFTNYAFYIDEFIRLGRELMEETSDPEQRAYRSQYCAFVEPGNVTTWNANHPMPEDAVVSGVAPARQPQMPAYHLQRVDGSGITLVNIGVGPSNAKTITDHIAVLRPHGWIMLGHCAGLSSSQRMGDYVLAHAYVRDDHVLDDDLPLWVPIPALAEVQLALQEAVAGITQLEGYELKRIMRTGTVASVDDRNWELRDHRTPLLRFSQSRAIALDMESATVAANGFRFRVPYGTLLCVSDKPLHGEIKLPGMANRFYEQRVAQHLKIGIRALELLRTQGVERLHSRKLRSFGEPAFR